MPVGALARPMRVLAGFVACLLLLALPASAAELPASTGIRPDGSSAAAPASPPGDPGEPAVAKVADGLDAAVNIAFGPGGELYFGEWKTGDVYRIGENGAKTKVLDVGTPAWGNERGFVGLAVDKQGSFYTFTTYEDGDGGWFNRLSRWDDGTEVPLLDKLEAGDWHNSGRIQIDPRDGSVWVAYGDVDAKVVAQDPNDLRGSILHMTRDGKPIEGNVGDDGLVHSYGHRQAFGFAVDWKTGRVMVAENMDQKNDEVSVVKKGGNHGWNVCEGPCATPDEKFVDPVIYYAITIGPTSGAFFGGDFYFGDFNKGWLHRIYEHEGKWYDQIVHVADPGPILDLKPGPEGNTLYYSSWASIVKLTFPNVQPGTDGDRGNNGGGDNTTRPGPLVSPPDDIPAPPALLVAAAAAVVALIASRPGR